MSELALQLIAENKAKRERGEDATYLDLGNCGLMKLPVMIKELDWLETLILSDRWWDYDLKKQQGSWQNSRNQGDSNKIISIKGVEKLTSIKKLIVAQKPDETGKKKSRKLNDLSPLQGLRALQQLDCSYTWVSDLSPMIELSALLILDCSYTQVSDLSPLKGLSALQILYCYSTQVSDLSPLQGLSALQILYCSSTQVSDLSPLQGLGALQQLFCFSTQISDLSPLQGLSALQILYCSSTQVSDLSPLLSMMKRVPVKWQNFSEFHKESPQNWRERAAILVKDCPLINPPVEIAKQGNQAILAYWEQIEKQGTGTLNEAKLIIVGEGKTGKTTLFNKLIDPEFDLQKHPTDETHGINIHEGLAMPEDFRTNLWDFGGQELQYMTHQFFLSPKALYVLIMEARAEAPNLAYWFKIISLLGKDSPDEKVSLLLVLNKKKGGTGMPQYQDLLKLYEQDFDYQFLEVDFAKNDKRWECLHEAIMQRLSALPIVKNLLPKQWKPIREALREESKEHDYISTTRLNEICSEYEVTSETDQWQMTDYLHRLGSLLHFQNDEDLMDLVILRPEWAVEGVYTTLKSDLIKEDQKGKFTAQDIFNILNKKDYSKTDAQKILKLMSKNNFDICYESEQKGQYVAAQLLPDNRPDQFRWHTYAGALQFRYQYPVMPKGLMSRLIVRLSGYLEIVEDVEIVWKKGAILNITKDGSTCRLMMQEDDGESKSGLKQIIIEVMEDEAHSRNRKYALEQVRREIISIHQKWFKNIQFEEIVPCNCELCKKSKEPFTYLLSELLKLSKGRAFCNRLQDTVPLTQLLEGVYQTEEIGALTRSSFMGKHEREMDPMSFSPVFNIHVDNQPQINISNVNQSDLSALETMLKQMPVETRQALETFVETLPEPETPDEKTGLGKSIVKWLNKNAEGIAVNVSASVYYDALKMLLGI